MIGANSVAVADVNGDGKPDVILTGGSVIVLLGNGNGTFQAQTTFASGSGPLSVVAADVNADGKVDLAYVNSGSNSVGVMLGNGNGSFQSQQAFGVGSLPWSVTAADVNGDGNTDLIAVNYFGNSATVLLGNGNGTFQTQPAVSVGANPYFITTADTNADGIPDLIIANINSSTVSVLLGNGNGTFQTATAFAAGLRPLSVAASDLNGDGKIDLAVADYGGNTVSVLLGNGNGTFQTLQTLSAGSHPRGIVAADLNADGKLDLIVPAQDSNNVGVFLNSASGSFTGQTYTILQTFPKVLSINRSNPIGPSTSASSVTYAVTFSTPVTGVVAGDFVAVPLGGASYIGPLVVAGSGAAYTVTVNGISGNGTLGLNLVDNGAIHDLAGNPLQGTSPTFASFTPQQTFPSTTNPLLVVASDINGDGHRDIIVVNTSSNSVGVMLGNGNGTFQSQRTFITDFQATYTTAHTPWSIAVADVNGDSKPFLLFGSWRLPSDSRTSSNEYDLSNCIYRRY